MKLPKKSERLSSRKESTASMLFDPDAFYGLMLNSMVL